MTHLRIAILSHRPSTYHSPTCNMLIDLIQSIPMDLIHSNVFHTHFLQSLPLPAFHLPMPHDSAILAQYFKPSNISGEIAQTWQHFVKTGQVWAFLVGVIFGYLAKSFTSYG